MAAWPTVDDLAAQMQAQSPLSGDKLAVAELALESVTEWIADRCELYELEDGVIVEDEAGDPVRLATIPAPVAQAILLYAAKIYRRKDTPDGVAGMAGEAGVIRTGRWDSDAESLLGPYVMFTIG